MVEVVMPQMGESLAEGTIVRWLKAPGDPVAVDEPLVEISTDKVDTDVPSPVAGILARVLVQEQDTVAVGAVIAVIAQEAPRAGDRAAGSAVPAAVAPAADTASAAVKPGDGHFQSSHAPQVVSFRRDASASTPPAGVAPTQPARGSVRPASVEPRSGGVESGDRSRAAVFTPGVLGAARAGHLSLDALTSIAGSGRGGRITKRDVEAFLTRRLAAVPDAGAPRATSFAQASETAIPPEFLYQPRPGDRRVAMSPTRKRIARHMAWSARISPHATAFAEVNMAAAAALIARAKAAPDEWRDGPLTYTVIAAQATIRALADFEALNASVLGDDIVYKPHINLGIAVALPDTHDLIVPVVARAEELSTRGLARAIHDLAARARQRALAPDDVQGGTFTLTNPGIFGGVTGTPILNQPQVAILGLGGITRRAVVIDDGLAVRPMMTVGLTFDHRAADGMLAFRFLDRVRQLLEAPDFVA